MRFIFILLAIICSSPILAQQNTLPINQQWEAAIIPLLEKEDYPSAIAITQTVLDSQLRTNKQENWLKTALHLANLYKEHQQFKYINDLLSNILDTLDTNTLPPLLVADALHQKGVALNYLEQHQAAIDFFLQALHIRKQSLPLDTMPIIYGFYNIGENKLQLGQLKEAISYLDTALQKNLNRLQVDTLKLADTYLTLGIANGEKGAWEAAEAYFKTAQSYYEKFYQDSPWELLLIQEEIAAFYTQFEIPKKAIYYAQKNLEMLASFPKLYDEDYWSQANAYNNMGISYEQLNRLDTALHLYQQSLLLNQRFFAERKAYIAYNYNNIAFVHKKKGQLQQALRHYNQALAVESPSISVADKADFLHNRGLTYHALKEYEKAIIDQQEAITYTIDNFSDTDIYQNPNLTTALINDKFWLIEFLAAKANALYALSKTKEQEKNLLAATATFEVTNQLIQEVRQDFNTDASKTFLVAKSKTIYENALAAVLALYALSHQESDVQKALSFIEQSKAIILLDAIKKGRADLAISEELLAQERTIKQRLTTLKEQLTKHKNNPDTLLQLRTAVSHQQIALQQLQQQIEQSHPKYHQLKYDKRTLSLQALKTQLVHKDQAIIEYLVGEKRLYSLLITSDTVLVHQQSLENIPLADWITQLRNSIYAPFDLGNAALNPSSSDSLYRIVATQLYQTLIEPLGKLPQRVLLIPDGLLGFIPFDALLLPSNEEQLYHQLPYLGYAHQLSYGFSISAVLEAEERPSKGNGKWIAFAPSFKDNAHMLVNNRTRNSLSSLFHNQEEVQTIQEILGGQANKPLLDQQASKAQFLQLTPAYSYIHLSSHALMNPLQPEKSFIAFTQTSTQIDSSELLSINELYQHPLDAEMVVLSACETGIGKLNKGEGLISLARAFTYAGAKSIVTTLWKVNDKVTTQLMVDFYRNLVAQKPKDEALWLAKRKMIEEGHYAHPYYWAGFIPIGNMEAIPIHPKGYWYWLLAGVVLVLGLLTFYYYRQKRKGK